MKKVYPHSDLELELLGSRDPRLRIGVASINSHGTQLAPKSNFDKFTKKPKRFGGQKDISKEDLLPPDCFKGQEQDQK